MFKEGKTTTGEISEIKKKLEEYEERISRLEKLFRAKPEKVKKELSIKEFLLSKNLKTNLQKVLTIAYYIEKYKGLTSFNTKDLERGFRSAKENIPRNINYEVIRNIRKGYMMEAEEKKNDLKAWYLTNSGERRVERNFENES